MLIDTTTWRSPNYHARPAGKKIDSIVLHTGEGSRQGDLSWLTSTASGVSAHFYIDRAGSVYQLVDLLRVAWHAGNSWYWAGWFWRRDWNTTSIGIETEHKHGQSWPALQVARLAELTSDLARRYSISNKMIVAHSQIAWPRGRRTDPTNWPDNRLQTFIAERDKIGLYRVKIDTLPSARIREHPEASGAVRVLGNLNPGALLAGRVVEGTAYNGNSAWIELMPGPGNVWAGLVEVVP